MRFVRLLFPYLKYVLAFGLLAWVVASHWDPAKGGGLKGLWQKHFIDGEPFGWTWALGSLLCQTIALLITLVRWHGLVIALDLVCPLRDAIRLGLAGNYASVVLPGAVGGDLVKAAFLARRQPLGKTRAVASVLMDRIIALANLFLIVSILGGISLATGNLEGGLNGKPGFVVQSAWGLAGITILLWLFLGLLSSHRVHRFAGRLRTLLPGAAGEAAAHFWLAVHTYRTKPLAVTQALALSWLAQTFMVLSFFCISQSVTTPEFPSPSLGQTFLILPVGLIIMAIPLFPGGAGIAELGFGVLFGWFGASESLGITATLLNRAMVWTLAAFCFIAYAFSRDLDPGQSKEALPACDTSDPSSEELKETKSVPM